MICRIVRGWSAWVVGLVIIAATLEAHGQFFAMRAGNDGEKEADWTVKELLEHADEALDRQWEDKLKSNRARAMLYYDEVIRTCKLSDAQKHKLRAAAKGMAHKMTWQWRQRIEDQLISTLEEYHRQGVSRAQARNVVASYTQGHIYFGSSGLRNAPQVFWNRSVASVLDEESRKRLKEREKNREERLKSLQKEWILATLDLGLRLSDEQEAKLRKILESEAGSMGGMGMMGMAIRAGGDDLFEMPTVPGGWVIVQLFQSNSEALKILSKDQREIIKALMESNEVAGGLGGMMADEDEEEADDDADGEEDDEQGEETDGKASKEKTSDATETNGETSKEEARGGSGSKESDAKSSGDRA